MNKEAKNAIWIIGCKLVQSLLAFFVGMLTARYLGPYNYGLITYAASLVAFVVPISTLGLNNIIVREIVDNPELEGLNLGTAILLNLISSFFCIIGVTVFSAILNPNEPITTIVCFLYSLILLFQALEQINYWFQAKLLSKYTSIVSLCAYSVVAAYKIYLLATGKSIYWFAISNAMDACLIAVANLVIYNKLGGKKLSFSFENGKRMFAKSRFYIVSSMMVTVFAQTDKIMLKQMLNDAAVGYYGAAVACAGLTSFVFTAIIDSFRPSVFEGYKINQQVFERRLIMLYSMIIYLSLAQCMIMATFSGLIVHIIYGDEYKLAGEALRIIVWYTTFSYLGSVRNIWILAYNEQKQLWKINLSGALANVLLNTLLIPIWGVNGAALASLITQFFTNVVIGFLIPSIRGNNAIMLRGCNPRHFVDALRHLLPKKNK